MDFDILAGELNKAFLELIRIFPPGRKTVLSERRKIKIEKAADG